MTTLAPLMAGKRGVVLGVANDRSIAWGIARTLAGHGAELAFTYQGDSFERRVRPLAEQLGAGLVLPCDVSSDAEIEALFAAVGKAWGGLDFVVHSLAYSEKEELQGRYSDTSRANFARTMDISCYSFTAVAKRAAALMTNGGAMITLTYSGAERVMPFYNVMGVAKAALEASVRYLAVDLGPQGVRVNALSAGPVRTLAGSAIGGARQTFRWTEQHSPLRRNVSLEELGGAALYLLSDLSHAVTGEVHHVDSGYNIVSVPGLPDEAG
ncbi:MAG: SDR family oxidoreductase [Alphaproteobacteria bacterium]|nr:SDR family oxidoreductase [Alphaproteobacteria bacterium]